MIIDSIFEELGGNLSEPVTPIAEPSTLPPLTFKKGASGSSSYNGEIKPSSSKSANYAYQYYVGKGLPKHIAAGIVGNLMQESNLDPNIVNKQSGAYGVAQWLGSRKTNYLKKYGKTNTFENQLDFVLEELDTTEKKAKDKLFKARNTQEATTIFANDFERMGQHEANHPRRLKNAMSLNPYKYGGKLPKHALGALLALGSGVNNLLGETVASFNGDKPYMDKGLGAVSGFFKGNAALPGIGGIVGGVKGYLDAQKEKKIYDQAQANKQREFTDAARIRSTMTLNPNVQNKGVYSYYAKGGKVDNPQYEVEKDEIVTGNAQLSNSTPLASDIQQVTGYTHEEYNPETGGTGVNGSGGDKVYSNSIVLGDKTIAGHAKEIARKIGKQEKAATKTDSIGRQTATLNVYKYKQQLDALFQAQEHMKEAQGQQPVFKYGGELPKLDEGADLEKEYNKIASKNVFKTTADRKRLKEIKKRMEEIKPKDVPKQESKSGIHNVVNPYSTGPYGKYNITFDKPTETNKPASKPYMDMFSRYEVPKPVAPKKSPIGRPPKVAKANVPVQQAVIPQLQKPAINLSVDGTNIGKDVLKNETKIQQVTPDFSGSVQGALGKTEMSGVTKPKGFNWAGAAESVAPFISSAANYLAVNNGLNKIDTNVPVSTIQASPYNYYDKSGLARNTLRQGLSSVLRNDNISAANKQNAFAQFLGAGNQLEDAERNAKLQYDSDYTNRAWQIDAQNNAMITDAQRQRIGMKNEVRQAKINNTNNLFQNVNTGVQQLSRMTNDRKKLDILARSYPNMGKDVLADIYKILQP